MQWPIICVQNTSHNGLQIAWSDDVKRVPELAAEVDKHGGVKGIAVTAMRGASGDKQPAHFGSTGEDFAVAGRLP
jgi:hypothetical protein